MTDGLNWPSLVGGIALLGILAVLSIAALAQGSHDALVALISLVTGVGIGTSGVVPRPPQNGLVRQVGTKSDLIEQPQRPAAPESQTGPQA